VTIVVRDRECLLGDLGDIVSGEMRLNDYGHIVAAKWQKLPARFPHATTDASIVMPNHLHGIIVIGDVVGAKRSNRPINCVSNDNIRADALPLRTDTSMNQYLIP
jgi:hypothetical protein